MLNHLEGKKLQAHIRIEVYQQQIWVAHHKKLKGSEISTLRRVPEARDSKRQDKWNLRPNWEGPYIITQGGKGSYTLAYQDMNQLKKQWNYSLEVILRVRHVTFNENIIFRHLSRVSPNFDIYPEYQATLNSLHGFFT